MRNVSAASFKEVLSSVTERGSPAPVSTRASEVAGTSSSESSSVHIALVKSLGLVHGTYVALERQSF